MESRKKTSHIIPRRWRVILQNWITSALFAFVLLFFVMGMVGLPLQQAGMTFLRVLLLCGLLGLLFHFWKISLPLVGVFAFLVFLQGRGGWTSFPEPLTASYWQNYFKGLVDSVVWLFHEGPGAGSLAVPSFPTHLLLSACFFSVLSNWLLPIPILTMVLLVAPLFFIDDLTALPHWIPMLLAGLFCVYSSYAFRQDPSGRDQRPSLSFAAILLAMTFLLQSVIPPNLFFNEKLSRRINDYLPSRGQEIHTFSLKELGFYPQGNLRVGGTVKLSEEPYMTVRLSQPLSCYLKGSAYDSFDGHSWGLSEADSLSNYQWEGDYYNDFSSHLSSTFWFPSGNARDFAVDNGLVTPLISFIKTVKPTYIVFHGGHPVNPKTLVQPLPQDKMLSEAIADKNGNLNFLYSQSGMLIDKEYYNDYGLLNLDYMAPVVNSFRQETLDLLQPEKKEAPRKLEKLIRHYDPQLAAYLYDQASETDFVLLIDYMRSYFDSFFRYSLEVPNISDSEDFLEHFLSTKKGYCVYFATAWSLILNDLGYETRYVEGFVVPKSSPYTRREGRAQVLTAKQAHAWLEVKTENCGWYPIEATPTSHISSLSGMNLENPEEEIRQDDLLDPQEAESSINSHSSASEISSEESSSSSAEDFSSSRQEEQETQDTSWKLSARAKKILRIIFFLALILAAVFAFFSYKKTNWQKRQNFASLTAMSDPSLAAHALWAHIQRLALLNGLSFAKKDTIRDIYQKIEALRGDISRSDGQQAINTLEGLYFGSKEPSEEGLRVLHDSYLFLEDRYQKKAGRMEFLWKDVLTVKGRPWR